MRKSRRKWRRASAGDWMAGIDAAMSGREDDPFTKEDFEDFTTVAQSAVLDELSRHGRLHAFIYGIDARWRTVGLSDGSTDRSPHWRMVGRIPHVFAQGSLADNKPLIQAVFKRCNIVGYFFSAEAWIGAHPPAGTPSEVTRSQSFGRSEAVLMEAHCPMVGSSRFTIAPMVRIDDSVTASVLYDAMDVHELYPSPLVLTNCIPHWNRHLVTEPPRGAFEGDIHD